MSENKQTIAVRPWVFIVLAIVVVALVGFSSYMYGQVQSLQTWVDDLTIAQKTAAAQPAPAAVAQATDVPAVYSLETTKNVFSLNVVKFGDASRKLLVVEVTDPSCPYCHVASGDNPEISVQIDERFKYVSDGGTYQPALPEIRKLVESGQASYAFVYYPGHSNGEMAAKALYCAFDQGKFWEAHDLLYSMAGYTLINETVKNDPAQAGALADFLKGALDGPALKTCLESGKYDTRLQDEQTLAATSLLDPQAGGTPTFILNDTRFNGAYPWSEMQPVAEAALK